MTQRERLLRLVATEIEALLEDRVLFVAVDGVDGAGKTWFGDELADRVSRAPVIRASIDGFHNPRHIRYAQGRDSPDGYFQDSFDYGRLNERLLGPLGPDGSKRYRTEAFDHRTDSEVNAPLLEAALPSVLILDGIFLHRPELRGYWDYSIFLEVSPRESVRRCIERAQADEISSDPDDPAHRRYVRGQQIYRESCDPAAHAMIVVNNENLEVPYLVKR